MIHINSVTKTYGEGTAKVDALRSINLDSVTGEQILDLLRETSVQTGTTVVMVTHDRSAAQVADRIVSVKDGSILSDERVTRVMSGAAE